ncbi:hypothetical protein Hanom_Chr00s000005g01612801 [Helianthus anomalus]
MLKPFAIGGSNSSSFLFLVAGPSTMFLMLLLRLINTRSNSVSPVFFIFVIYAII